MRVLVYPTHGYISSALSAHLQRSGHQLIPWDASCVEGHNGSWSAALEQASAIFHVLHGHEQHAEEALLTLLHRPDNAAPASFIGISTPLTWAATTAPPCQSAAETLTVQEVSASQPAQHAPPDGIAAASSSGRLLQPVLREQDAHLRRPAAAAVDTYHIEQLVLRSNRPGKLHTAVVCPGILYGAGEGDDQLHALWKTAWEGQQPLHIYGSGSNRLPTLHVQDLAAFCEAVALQQQSEQQQEQQQQQGSQQPRRLQQQQQQQGCYLLAVDTALVTQRQLVEGIGHLLLHADIKTSPMSLLTPPASPLQLLDLPLTASSALQQLLPQRVCPNGLLGHLPAVLQELLAVRQLSRRRILIRGPPAAGKTHLGLRLAQLYGLLHVNAATILAELQHMDPETQKAAHAQLSGREGRLSTQLMARLAQHLLLRHPVAVKQGWVLEGWPRSLSAACVMTSVAAANSSSVSSSGGSSSEGGGKGGRRDSTTSAGIKDKRRSAASTGGAPVTPAPGASPAAGAASGPGAARARCTAGDDEPAGPGCKGLCLQSPELLPHVLIELDVSEEELQRRVKVLAAAEAAAAAMLAAEASGGKTSSGSTKKPLVGGRTSTGGAAAPAQAPGASSASTTGTFCGPFAAAHNNLKDWGRRMDVYKQLLQDDAADLAAKRASVVAAYQATLAAEAGGDGALLARSSGRQSTDRPTAGGGGSRLATPRHAGRQSVGGGGDASAVQLPPDVKLPEHGGFVAYFVDAGAKYIKVTNAFDSTAASVAASPNPSRAATPRQPAPALPAHPAPLAPLPALEQQLMQEVGPPHNYHGSPPQAALCAGLTGDGQSVPAACAAASVEGGSAGEQGPVASTAAAGGAAVKAGAAGGLTCANTAGTVAAGGVGLPRRDPLEELLPDMARLREAEEALIAEAALREAASVSAAACPLVSSLMQSLMADLMAGLVQVALTRPDDPIQVIVDQLLAAANRVQSEYTDPYEDPVYAVQLAKVEAKAAREEARAMAAAAKAEREQAARAGDGSRGDPGTQAALSSGGDDSTKPSAAMATAPQPSASGPAPGSHTRPASSGLGTQKPSGRVHGSSSSVAHTQASAAR